MLRIADELNLVSSVVGTFDGHVAGGLEELAAQLPESRHNVLLLHHLAARSRFLQSSLFSINIIPSNRVHATKLRYVGTRLYY